MAVIDDNEKLIFKNAIGQEINLNDGENIILLSKDGLSGIEVVYITTKISNQYGANVKDIIVEPKIVTFTFNLVCDKKEDEDFQRDRLGRILSPLYGKGLLTYENSLYKRQTEAYVKIAPEFDDSNSLRPTGVIPFDVSFFLEEPLWQDEETNIMLTKIVPQFEFELEIQESGLEFSTLTEGEAEIFNDGAAETPLYFIFHGPAKNPKIILNNEKFIHIKDELFANEKMYISSKVGDKRVEILRQGGEIENAYMKINFRESKFFQLPLGTSYIKFDADTGSDEASIEIIFRKKYMGW